MAAQFFEDAVDLHGGDPPAVKDEVKIIERGLRDG
jgi:hypothetical protein